MAHYFFLKDLEEGRAAEKVVSGYLASMHGKHLHKINELPRDRQGEGDHEVLLKSSKPSYTVEVKFDKRAQSSGNLCFEYANGKGEPTGIAATQANSVAYIVPISDSEVTIFVFDTQELRDYLESPENQHKIKIVNGGDRRAYKLLLVSIENILKDLVAESVENISAELPI